MRYEEPLFHLFLLITIILIGLSLTSCVNWTPVEYIDAPITEPPLEKVVLEKKAIDKLNTDFDCFIGSSSDECADFELSVELVEIIEPVCDMDLCT